MTSSIPVRIRGGALLACLPLVLAGCKQAGQPAATQAVAKTASGNPMEITAHADLLRQIKTGRAGWSEVAGTLRVAGRVEADETRIARVSSPVTGRITALDVVEGQHVKRGDVVAVIHSTELSGAQSNLLKAEYQRRLAERAAARAKLLLDAGVIGEAELQRREAELAQANVEISSAYDQLRVLGMPEAAIDRLKSTRTVNSLTQVVATIDGTVLERDATIGQVVQAAESVCVLADLSSVWLVADLPEQAAGAAEVGKSVEAEIPAIPGLTVHGRLSFVSATVNPETHTVRVRLDLPNPHGRFKPAMLASILLKDGAERLLAVPSSAVVRESNRDHVFVKTGERTFRLQPVTLGEEFDGVRVLVAGLRYGETIVFDGAFHLNNERRRLALQGE